MINITDKIVYDENLSYQEQSDNTKQYIDNFINTDENPVVISEPAGFYPRPLKETWVIVEGLQITKNYSYKYPALHECNGEHTFNIERE